LIVYVINKCWIGIILFIIIIFSSIKQWSKSVLISKIYICDNFFIFFFIKNFNFMHNILYKSLHFKIYFFISYMDVWKLECIKFIFYSKIKLIYIYICKRRFWDFYQSNTIMHNPYISLQQIVISMFGVHPLLMTNLLFLF